MKSKSMSTTQALAVALVLQGGAAAAEAGASAEAAVPSAAAVTVAANTVAANEVANAAAETPADDQQLPASAQAEPTSDVEEVTVTGSRIAGAPATKPPRR